jgi:PAS domain-containing protein
MLPDAKKTMPFEQNIANIFIDIIPDMCFVVSEERDVLFYNRRAREVLGLPESPVAFILFLPRRMRLPRRRFASRRPTGRSSMLFSRSAGSGVLTGIFCI